MALLEIDSVAVRFGGVQALANVSLTLNRGEILGLIGPNGAGKTTLFNCISGVVRPDGGRIVYDGRTIRPLEPDRGGPRGVGPAFPRLRAVLGGTRLHE